MSQEGNMNFENVLKFVKDFFDKGNVDYALIGGFALGAYGISRATVDLDILIHEENGEAIVRFLESLGYETLARSEAFSNHEHPIPAMGRIDFLYVSGETAETILGEAEVRPIFGNDSIKVVKPEHLIALKLYALSVAPHRYHREMEDVRALLGLAGIDREEVEGYFVKYASLEEYEKLMGGRS